jgi:hypothetical protein
MLPVFEVVVVVVHPQIVNASIAAESVVLRLLALGKLPTASQSENWFILISEVLVRPEGFEAPTPRSVVRSEAKRDEIRNKISRIYRALVKSSPSDLLPIYITMETK